MNVAKNKLQKLKRARLYKQVTSCCSRKMTQKFRQTMLSDERCVAVRFSVSLAAVLLQLRENVRQRQGAGTFKKRAQTQRLRKGLPKNPL